MPPEGAVNMDDLIEYVRRRLPIKARMIGQDRLREIVEQYVSQWPADALLACRRGSAQEQDILQALSHQVGLRHQDAAQGARTYGFVWGLLLSAVLSAVVQTLLRWWLDKEGNRVAMAAWKGGLFS